MTSSDTDLDIEVGNKLHIIEWEHLNLWKFYPMALTSSWSVRCLMYPMSVVKSRLALQKQNNVYRGMRHAFVDIIRKEGFTALYRGFWVTLPQLSGSFIYSTAYEGLRNVLRRHGGIDSAPIVSALAGGAASSTTQLIFVPTDIVAQYMMVYNNPSNFTGGTQKMSVVEALKHDGLEKRWTLGLRVIRAIYKVDGILGFYRGFFSSVLLYIPSSMVFWSTYYNVLGVLTAITADFSHSEGAPRSPSPTADGNLLKLQALSGGIGGVFAAICTNPLEVLRIRIQVHRTGYVETFRRLWVYEGTRVFTKGLAPRMISNGVYSFLIMLGYETVKRACVLPEYRESIVW
uniref:Solute carrier family 25 member 44 n=1 Tax=Panagrellus redivivus TaxID=6233 RepID=A0A7E4W0C4_PANRE